MGLLYLVISWPAARNLAAHHQLMNASFNRWQLANAYGAFGTVTKQRIEYVIEGSADGPQDAADWREYEFKGKPGDVRRMPRQWAPYHLRLDWLMWFLPLGRSLDDWFTALLGRLLEADAATLKLLARDPFDGKRPEWVRVVSYRYRFATRAEFRETPAAVGAGRAARARAAGPPAGVTPAGRRTLVDAGAAMRPTGWSAR